LEIAKIIREDFLQQDAFSPYDFMCPLFKTAGMMRCIIHYYDQAKKAIVESSGEHKITFNVVLNQTKNHFVQLSKMKFESPKQSRQEFTAYFAKFVDDITQSFRNLTDK